MTSRFAQLASRHRSQTARSGAAGWALGWLLLGLLAPAPVMAEAQPPIDLRWEAPPGCPQESDVRDRIQTLLGAARPSGPLRAEGTITRLDKVFRLDLVVRVRNLVGTRHIESNSCNGLAGAAAVELGLLIHSVEVALDPNRRSTQAEPAQAEQGEEPSSLPSLPSLPSGAPNARPSPETNNANPAVRSANDTKSKREADIAKAAEAESTKVEAPRTWHALVQVPIVELDVGPLPKSSRGIGLSLGLEYAHWQLQLKGISWQRQNVPAPGFPGYGADVDRIGVASWGCREFRSVWFGLSPCITVGLERVSATGAGPNVAKGTRQLFEMSVGAGAQGRIYVASWLRLVVAAGGQIQLSRPQLSVAGAQPAAYLEPYGFEVYRFAPAVGSIAVGLEWIL